jgi:hypothetical protein
MQSRYTVPLPLPLLPLLLLLLQYIELSLTDFPIYY